MVLKFDYITNKHYMEDEKTGRRIPFVKKIETLAIVIREMPSEELEHPVNIIYYAVPITYEVPKDVDDVGLSWHYSQNEDSPNKFMRVYVHRYSSVPFFVSTQECPLPNQLFEESIEKPLDLIVSKGKSKRITKEEATKLLLSGKTCGLFDVTLQNRFVM
jgi:hypothetical protein